MKKEVKIGLTVLAGVLVVYLALTWVKSMHFFSSNRQEFKIIFTDVSGLKEGDPVTLYGYPSGAVTQIKLAQQGVEVTVGLDENADIRMDAMAEVRIKELLGGKQIALDPGVSPEKFPKGQLIPGTASMDFATAFSKMGEFIDTFEGQDMEKLLVNINKIASTFARLGEEFDSLDTGDLLHNLESSASSMNNILGSAERRDLVGKLDRSLSKVDGLALEADKALRSITDLTEKLNGSTLPKTDSMLLQAANMLEDAEGMMATVRELMDQMKNPNTLAGRFLYDPEMSKQLDLTLNTLNTTLDHIRTKKIYVTMTLAKRQRLFKEEIEQDEKQKKEK